MKSPAASGENTIVEQMAKVKEFMNLRWTYESISLVPHRNSFLGYSLLNISEWMLQWYSNSPIMGAECQKIDQYKKGYLWFVFFGNSFVSEVFTDYFN